MFWSICSGVKDDLSIVTVNPAVENACSVEVDVADIFCNLRDYRKTMFISLHHISRDSSLSNGLSYK